MQTVLNRPSRQAVGLIALCLSLHVGAFVLTGNSSSSQAEANPPIWSVDLHAFGYAEPTIERDLRVYTFLHDSVAFLDNGTLAVSFLKKNDHPGLSRRDGSSGSPVVFHTVLMDSLTGRAGPQRTWGNESEWNRFLPLENGDFLVQDEEWLRVYSQDFQKIASKRPDRTGDLVTRYAASPTGRSLYEFQDAHDNQRGWLTRISLLDAATLAVKKSKITPGHKDETVSDTEVVYQVENVVHEFLDARVLFVYHTDDSTVPKSPRLLEEGSATAKLVSKSNCTSAAFVDNSVLAVTGGCSWLILLQRDAEVAELHSPEYTFGGEIGPSREGRRFAFVRYQTKGKPARVTRNEICVYELGKRKVIFAEPVVPTPRYKLAFALSPDGSLLALESDNLVRVWRLEPFWS